MLKQYQLLLSVNTFGLFIVSRFNSCILSANVIQLVARS